MSLSAIISRFRAAFPSALTPTVDACLSAIPIQQYPPSQDDIGPIYVGGEALHIPFRIYPQPPAAHVVGTLGRTQKLILACLMSRHHDGFERERQVSQLLSASQDWVPPFVLQLVGEYVVEIIEVIALRVDDIRNDRYSGFAADNHRFIALTKQRTISYWDEYYRHRFSRFVDYPGFKVLDALGLWSRRELRRRWLTT